MSKFKVAGVQMDIEFGEPGSNLDKMQSRIDETTANGAQLTVFPECTTTGYCFESLEEAKEVAEGFDGPSVTRVHQWCREKNTMVVFGFLELDGERIFNASALVGPEGLIGRYRKIHIPQLGVDRFVTPGDRPFEVVQTPQVRIGMNICYDSAFPESARVLAIKGADLITLPTNWPPTSTVTANVIPAAGAGESCLFDGRQSGRSRTRI